MEVAGDNCLGEDVPIQGNEEERKGGRYEVQAHEVVIVAVMHLRRHPSYWIDRAQ